MIKAWVAIVPLPHSTGRFPRQSEDWLGMTLSVTAFAVTERVLRAVL